MILILAQQSFGIAAGTFLGVSIGLFARRRRGSEQWLLGGSVIATAIAASAAAFVVAMFVNFLIGVFA